MAALTTSLPYTTGVPNSTIDAINAAIDELNLAGGDAAADRIPDNANVADAFSDLKVGTVAITGAATTVVVTTSFTADGVIATPNLTQGVLTAAIVTTNITFTRTVTTDSSTIFWIAWQSD